MIVAAMAARVVERLAAAPRPVYATLTPPSRQRRAGTATTAFLGVQGSANADGARLAGVIPGASAHRAGLREGDVVIRLAGARLASFDDLRTALRERRAGDRVDVVFVRNGEQRAVTATLDAYPDKPFPAKVRTVIPTADRQKATVKVRITIPNLEK